MNRYNMEPFRQGNLSYYWPGLLGYYGMYPTEQRKSYGSMEIYYTAFSTFTLIKWYKNEVRWNLPHGIDKELTRRFPHIWPIIRRFIK